MRSWLLIAVFLPAMALGDESAEDLFDCLSKPQIDEEVFLECFGSFSEQCNKSTSDLFDYDTIAGCFMSVVEFVETRTTNSGTDGSRSSIHRQLTYQRDLKKGQIECEYIESVDRLFNDNRDDARHLMSLASCQASFHALAYWQNYMRGEAE